MLITADYLSAIRSRTSATPRNTLLHPFTPFYSLLHPITPCNTEPCDPAKGIFARSVADNILGYGLCVAFGQLFDFLIDRFLELRVFCPP